MLNFYLQSIGKLMEYKLVKLFFIIPLILILTSSAYAQKTVSSTYVFSTGTLLMVGIWDYPILHSLAQIRIMYHQVF